MAVTAVVFDVGETLVDETRRWERVADLHGVPRPPADIAYVGDRLDNDVLPATRAGMRAVFLRRGPWGYRHALRPEAADAALRIDSLDELPPALEALG